MTAACMHSHVVAPHVRHEAKQELLMLNHRATSSALF
jgi:hypothetical protein